MSIKIDLRDKHLIENYKCIKQLREMGFSEHEIQELYDDQVKRDKESDNCDE